MKYIRLHEYISFEPEPQSKMQKLLLFMCRARPGEIECQYFTRRCWPLYTAAWKIDTLLCSLLFCCCFFLSSFIMSLRNILRNARWAVSECSFLFVLSNFAFSNSNKQKPSSSAHFLHILWHRGPVVQTAFTSQHWPHLLRKIDSVRFWYFHYFTGT